VSHRHNNTLSFTVLAKLKTGVTREVAQADMERVIRGIAERQPRNMIGLLAVALLACVVPAVRAVRVSPTQSPAEP
jgi:hypothetical protein